MGMSGGIDLGGTKIEATLFRADWSILDSRRVPTPKGSYDELLDALVAQTIWLRGISGDDTMPVGIGIPGLISPRTGKMLTANIPATGHALPEDLAARSSGPVHFINDCRAFALSEAHLGAGQGKTSVLGLVIGTGVAGGLVINGTLIHELNGLAGEYGHTPIPATLAQKHDLPLIECGCGKTGCFETLVAGPGLVRLAHHVSGQQVTTTEVVAGALAGDTAMQKTLDIWTALLATLVQNMMHCADPDIIVLGGGLSNIRDLPEWIAEALEPILLPGTYAPEIHTAQGGDSSGTRGAALAARLNAGGDIID